MSGSTQELRILEEDMGADAITFENYEEGVTYLFVRPKQSFEYAVKSIQKVCPEMSLSRVQQLVRDHCKTVVEMNERLGADLVVPRFEAAPDAGVVPPAPMKMTGQHRRPRPPRWAKVAAVAAPALAGGMLLAQWLNPSPKNTSSTSPVPSISQDDKVAAGTYRNPAFEKIAAGGEMKCDPIGAYEAKCVDADGKVMYSEASVGTSTAFTFSYDTEKIGFRLFSDADSASAWAAEEANRDLYQNVMQYGSVVLWGTDAERLREWGNSLTEHEREQRDRAGSSPAMAPMLASAPIAPLPDRLAFLAFGTLGVTEETIQRAVERQDVQSAQLLRAVELVLGNADGSQFDIIPTGPSDAVAIVADAVTPPTGDKTEVHGDLKPAPVQPQPKPVVTPTPEPAAETETRPPAEEPASTPPEPEPEPEPETAPEPEPEPAADQSTTQPEPEPAPVEDPQEQPAEPEPEPVEDHQEQPAEPEPGPAPVEDDQPVTHPAEDVPHAETPPAPPVTEEPEDDGLALDAMPTQWAA
ncbi:hypothetical protein [Streptomyces coeruleorubidus]|uniref:hypothetical protein n=1 Tax=Streptomyces coeruleorubidus TaxID=116188 RepID=UPI0033A3641F